MLTLLFKLFTLVLKHPKLALGAVALGAAAAAAVDRERARDS